MRKILFFILISFACFDDLKAQDPHFTQFYAAPTYLNPSFVGTARNSRITSIYRNQWSKLPGDYNTANIALDHNLKDLHSGVGLLFTADRQGVSSYKLNELDLVYSYGVQIQKKWALRTGLQFGWAQRSLKPDELVFGNQLDVDQGFTGATSGEFSNNPTKNYLNISSGLLAYSKYLWVGFSAHNINRPNQSFLTGGNSIVPVRYSLHAKGKIEIVRGKYTNNKRVYYLSPAMNYRKQGKNDQLDLGFYINYQPIVFGAWYRGIPVTKRINARYVNQDALAVLIGFHYQDFLTIGYSYDLTISSLGPGSGGSHELSVGIEIDYPKKPQKPKYDKFLPCPKF